MAGAMFDASQLRELAATMGTEAARVGREGSQAVRKRADEVKTRAQAIAPKRTGRLGDSIGVDQYGDGRSMGLTAVVGPTERYGLFVENGTAKMAAQPFMAPAFEAVAPQLQADIEKLAGGFLS